MLHCGVADDSEIRRENYRRWCHTLTPDGSFSPTAVKSRLGNTTSLWSDLYHARKSFGEKQARSIEEKAGLPRMSLDQVDPMPLSQETVDALGKLPEGERLRLENSVRALLGLPQLAINEPGTSTRKQAPRRHMMAHVYFFPARRQVASPDWVNTPRLGVESILRDWGLF